MAVLFTTLLVATAGRTEDIQALVDGPEQWSFFVRPEFKLTSIGNKAAELVGIQLGPSLNRKLYIGLAGYALVNSLNAGDDNHVQMSAFDLWYVGGAADYTFFSSSMIHGSVGLFVGGGRANVNYRADGSDGADIFVCEPNANLMFNLTTTIELGIGAGYRFVNGATFDRFSNGDLSGVSGTVFLRWTED